MTLQPTADTEPATQVRDDAVLLGASRAGSLDAFAELVERYQNLVCAVSYSKTGDRALSEDVGQETFLVAWTSLASLREPEKLASWLCGIARNLASKAVRRRRREQVGNAVQIESQVGSDPGPLDALLAREVETKVWAALERLPETYREPLILFYREEQSIKQVASGLGLSEEAAKQRLSRGRSSLKDGVAELVERNLEAGRPRKAFAAAVVAVLAAASGASAAASSAATASASKPAHSLVRLAPRGIAAAGALAAVVALGVGITVSMLRDPAAKSGQSDALDTATQRQILAQLHRHRDARATVAGRDGSCRLAGTVHRADGGPISGAMVAMLDPNALAPIDPTVVETDARGGWQLGRRPAGDYMISVTAPGLRANARIVRCDDSTSQEQRTALEPGGTLLRGTVSDIGGGPIGEVTVWVLAQGSDQSKGFAIRTGTDGRYQVLLPKGLYTLLLVHPEYTLDVRPVTVGDSAAREDFALLPGATVEGTVVDSVTGRPVANASVHTVPASFRSGAPPRWILAATYGAMQPNRADQHGRFRLRGLPPGTVRLSARSEDGFASMVPVEVALTMAEEKSGVAIPLVSVPAISGFVVRREDERRGLAGVRVIAQKVDSPFELPAMATTDASGYFEIAGVTPGQVRLIGVEPSSPPKILERDLSVSDRDVEDVLLVLERGVALRGRVEPAGAVVIALEPASVASLPDGLHRILVAALTRAEVDERGNFVFPAVGPGDYVVKATSYDHQGRLAVAVTASDPGGLLVRLEPRPAIAGQVVLESGAPLANAVVQAQPDVIVPSAGPMLHNAVRTDERGRFRIVGVEPGRHELRVFDDKGQRPWKRGGGDSDPFSARAIDVPAAGAAEVKLEVASGGRRVAGIVVGSDGKPVADAWVRVEPRAGRTVPVLHESAPILTNGDGRFSIDGLFGDEIEIQVTGPRGNLRAATRTAPRGDIALQLRPVSTLIGKVSHQGKPVAEFEARITQESGGSHRLEPGKSGAIEVPDMIAGEYRVEIESQLGYLARSIEVGPGPTTPVDLALTPWASMRGRLVDGEGRPLSGASLLIVMPRSRTHVGTLSAKTDAHGAFDIERLTEGSGSILLSHSNEGEARMIRRLEFEIRAGQRLDVGTVAAKGSLLAITTRSRSEDLGMRFFLGAAPPTEAELAAIDEDPAVAYRDKGESSARVWIATVDRDSPAGRAGLRAGDRLLRVGRRTVGDGESAAEAMMSLSQAWRSKGRPIDWVVDRGGRELKVTVTVAR